MDDVLARVELPRRRFTVEEFHRMSEAGVFTEGERVELIEGEIVPMTPIGRHHAHCVAVLNRRLVTPVGDRAVVHPQNPIRLLPDTEPQPDLMLLRPPENRYWEHAPEGPDVLLLVEVADTSYRRDRDVKLPLYARAGIPEVWIVALPHATVEMYRDPHETAYASFQCMQRGMAIAPTAFPDVVLKVSDLLPPL